MLTQATPCFFLCLFYSKRFCGGHTEAQRVNSGRPKYPLFTSPRLSHHEMCTFCCFCLLKVLQLALDDVTKFTHSSPSLVKMFMFIPPHGVHTFVPSHACWEASVFAENHTSSFSARGSDQRAKALPGDRWSPSDTSSNKPAQLTLK